MADDTSSNDSKPLAKQKPTTPEKIGHNDKEQLSSLSSFLIPTVPEVILLALLVVLVIIGANYKIISQTLSTSAAVAQNDAAAFQPQFTYLNNLFTNRFFAQTAVWMVWAIVGAVCYMAIWGFQHFYLRVKEDVQESNYVKSVTVRDYWYSKLGRYVFLFCNVFIFLIFLAGCISIIGPFTTGLARITITHYRTLSAYRYTLYGLLLLTVAFYCLVRLWHLVVYAYRTSFGQLE